MTQQIKCHYKAKGEVKETTNNTVTKFYCDIDKASQYPCVAEFQFFGDKVNIDHLKEGQEIEIYYNINGRKWTNPEGKEYFFQSLNAWKIDEIGGTAKIEVPAKHDGNVGSDEGSLTF